MSRRPSSDTNRFNQVATADIPRSSFDLSHGIKTTFNCDDLVPILNMEILPGDSINLRAAIFARMSTPLKPLLDNLHCETFFFFTPTRQVWENWIRMHGEQDNPDDSIDFIVPTINSQAGFAPGTLMDYYGLPTGIAGLEVSALPLRCYNWIYMHWFRDQNIIDSPVIDKTDGPDLSNMYYIRKRRKRKDYFSGCLPWPQKFQDVSLSFGDRAEVFGEDSGAGGLNILSFDSTAGANRLHEVSGTNVVYNSTGSDGRKLYADLSTATGVSINDLRESIQIQRLLERDARGGTRYPELLRSHFGVTDPSMLVHQRPVFLGGGHTMVNINPIAQTNASSSDVFTLDTPLGNLAAIGTIAANNHGFTYSATEHGFITGIINVRADLTYQQGVERYWSRRTRFDHFYPALGHLGEMAVLNKEIYAQANADDDEVFGYQEAWADLRYIPSKVTGLFRSTAAGSLDAWHLAEEFANLPTLSQEFVEYNTPMDRVVAVPAEPDFLLDVYFKIKAARPLPLYGTPGMLDHF